MKKSPFILIFTLVALIFIGCKDNKKGKVIETNTSNAESLNAGDTTIYGTMIDGGMNSLVLVTDKGDTI